MSNELWPYPYKKYSSRFQWADRGAPSLAVHLGDSLFPPVQMVVVHPQALGSSHPTTGLLQSPPLYHPTINDIPINKSKTYKQYPHKVPCVIKVL